MNESLKSLRLCLIVGIVALSIGLFIGVRVGAIGAFHHCIAATMGGGL
ncbi:MULTISPECIES: hypothetical protein [unclassified Saccharibacter]|nr:MULTISPECIES: hypothetical protein [unclassified Saccharibacter]MXV35824.1 hypothetical protein [Saccharibacter sp. EH611]MXV57945.1 hypothetical protein [Saccharibacter sp. EH70]MXV66340.1 hypothetical protein [Saccharibacter sp. EH60]